MTAAVLAHEGLTPDRAALAAIAADAVEAAVDDPTVGAALGWFGIGVPEAAGGAGGSFGDLAVVIEAAGAHHGATAAPWTAGVVAALLGRFGAASDGPLLAQLAAGAVAAVAIGSPAGIAARLAGSSRGLTGSVLCLGPADAPLVAVPVGEDAVAVLATEHPALRLETVTAIDVSRPHCRLRLDGLPLAAAAAVVAHDELHAEWVARVGAIAALDAAGAARTALTRTLDYARQRRQFDRPIGSFQAYKHRCATAFVELKLAQSLAFRAADVFDTGDAGGEGGRSLALAAALSSTSAAAFVCGEAVQLHGGIGFTWEAGLHVLLKRARVDEIIAAADGTTARLLLRDAGHDRIGRQERDLRGT